MSDHYFIFSVKYRIPDGQKSGFEQLNCFRGSLKQAKKMAHKGAQKLYNDLVSDGLSCVRVEIWQVIATSYKGTVREAK